jgi:hypothetical protein
MTEQGTCLDSESIGAFADGTLRGEALAMVSEHLLTCDECLSAVGAANRAIAELGTASMGTNEMVEPIAFRPRRRTGWWLSAAAAIAATAVLGFWLPMSMTVEYQLKPMAARLKGKDRPIGPRLTGLPYGEFHSDRGSAHPAPVSVQYEADRLRNRKITSSVDKQAAGIGDLVEHQATDAVPFLESAAGEKPTASVYSDLAAAYYETSKYTDALKSADAALKLDPTYPPALFNRALILEQIDPIHSQPAINAWNAYRTVDKDSLWAKEAKERADTLQSYLH